jgi:hypothetical protein
VVQSLLISLNQFVSFFQSGCYTVDGVTLTLFVKGCARLIPEKLSYCSEIEDGPYFDKANGCLNLDCGQRFCCRKLRNY